MKSICPHTKNQTSNKKLRPAGHPALAVRRPLFVVLATLQVDDALEFMKDEYNSRMDNCDQREVCSCCM